MVDSKSAKLVDETHGLAYLAPTMTRHFLALLALLTGLAALGGPAHASLGEALACSASIAAAAGDEVAGGETAAVQPVPATIMETRALAMPEARSAAPDALRLPVLMGIERAFE